jgi:hypothetical protein
MTFDPYTNRIPHGLLTDDEKAALEATGGPWEFRYPISEGWIRLAAPEWSEGCIYRSVRKPLPVPQRGDVWVAPYGDWYVADPEDDVAKEIAKRWRLFREVRA